MDVEKHKITKNELNCFNQTLFPQNALFIF